MAATDIAFSVKVDDRTFTLTRITLGDWLMFKTEFGLTADDIIMSVTNSNGDQVQILNVADPGVLIGLMVAALRHERPNASVSTLRAEIEDLGMEGLEFPGMEESDETDPTKGGDDASEATASRAKSGKSAKPRKQPGTPR